MERAGLDGRGGLSIDKVILHDVFNGRGVVFYRKGRGFIL